MEPRVCDDGSTEYCLGGTAWPRLRDPPPPPSLVSTGSSPSSRCVGSLTSGLALSAESPRSAPLEEGPSYGNPQSIIGTPPALSCPWSCWTGFLGYFTQFHEDRSWPQRMSPHSTHCPRSCPVC